MEIVKHKTLGTGEIINRNDNRITVRFQCDESVRVFNIPQAFQTGFLTTEGNLKVEIDEAIAKLEEAKKATVKPKEEQQREMLINRLCKSKTRDMAYKYIYKLLEYDTWDEKQIENLFGATVGASYGLKTLEDDDIYTFYKELLESDEGRKCSCESKITIMKQLEYIDSKLDWL